MTFFDFQRLAAQGLLAQKAGQPSNIVYYNLQEERRLSAEALSRPGSVADQLKRQRKLTDEAVEKFQTLSGETADSAPTEVRTAVAEARRAMEKLGDQRALVDKGTADQQGVYAYYTDLIAVDLRLFTALSHVDTGEVTWISKTLVNSFWAKEMLAREDAILARGWPSGKLSASDYQLVQQSIGAQEHLFTVQVVPYVPTDERAAWSELMSGPAWQAKAAVEQALSRPAVADATGTVRLPQLQDQWRQAVDQVNPQLVKAIETRTEGVVEVGKGSILSLLTRVALTAVIGLLAVVVVVIASWRLTRSLRRRINDLHAQAQDMEHTLPEVVERLARGEQVDVEAESRAITAGTHARGGGDELAQLGQAMNLARTSALGAAVRQAEQHRGFERLLQRIARRTQLLIGQQLRKLDALERRHEDPEVLEGLFDLDHLTARLRRYEENLVIMAGGQPQRKWRKPVPLLDVLRAAQGEVQEYRRIVLDVEGHPWLSERAVGPIAHVVAELMENAASFSKPPTPVDVRAAVVGRGLAIEIEDRGLGMEPEQYDTANALMAAALADEPPRTDMLARGDDIRLGFHVVARLASAIGLQIEFRPSAFGGTRVVVLVPGELILDGDSGLPDNAAVTPIPLARRQRPADRAQAPVPLASVTEMPAPALPAGTEAERAADTTTSSAVVAVDEEEERAAHADAAPHPGQAGGDWFSSGSAPGAASGAQAPSQAQAFGYVEYVPPSDDELLGDPVRVDFGKHDGFPEHGPFPEQDAFGARDVFDGPSAFGDRDAFGERDGLVGHDSLGGRDTFGTRDGAFPGVEADGYLHPPAEHGQPVEHGSPAPAGGGHGYDGQPYNASPHSAGDAPPAYPDIAYATVMPAEAPYADEQYRPADHYRLAERRQHDGPPANPLPGSAVAPADPPAAAPSAPTGGLQPPLPQRVRQASLAAELRIPPPPRTPYAGAGTGTGTGFGGASGPGSAEGPFQRPPRRSGATVGAFQRQSRAARGLDGTEDRSPIGGPAAGALPPGRGPLPPSGPASPTATGTPTPAPGPSPWALPAADPRTTRTEEQS
ncbi:nitrate- and nitrite sensing domain-containing protein [Kitasatospora purpeofusca]|uniref:sensor histidine kinase n=1 Tax=Kitasatospora purpeofusca TaxID=67352 RepID=UPI00225A6D15|nr:nitrate- and nitrite sensing domain-containing protein [Kitasatospora purpeofusca]MCX4688810.1 nitrate- and nitrite sensing domain-containing protein [Kitasatospora purpeofusca]